VLRSRFKLLLLLCGIVTKSWATFPDLNSMLQAYRQTAQVTDSPLYPLILALDDLNSEPDLQAAALLTLIPVADGSLKSASDGAMRQMLSVIGDRLIRLPPPDKASEPDEGVASGDELPSPLDHGVWLQILGDDIHQKLRSAVPGYHGQVLGAIVGRDFLFPHRMIGFAAGYIHSKVISYGPSGSFLDIKRFQGTLYGRYELERCPYYSIFALTIANLQYDNNRKILVPPGASGHFVFENIAQSDFSAWEPSVYLETGYTWKCGNFSAIPKAMLTYSRLDIGAYNENDAFALDLNVKYQDMNTFTLGVGAKLEYQNTFDKALVVPEMHAYVFHDFVNNSQFATANFFSGGYEFLSQGAEPALNSIEVGAGLAVHSYKDILVTMQYDYAARTDYYRNCAFIKVRYEWA